MATPRQPPGRLASGLPPRHGRLGHEEEETMARMLKTVLDGLAFPEGPRWRDGRLWFSDMHGHEVVAMSPDGTRETVFRHSGPVSGLGWLPDGRMLVVSMNDRKL